MSNLAHMAASEWARTNTHAGIDPVEFGNKVAQVYCACVMTERHAGDEVAMAASLAALSIPFEVLQRLAQVSLLLSRSTPLGTGQTDSAGAR